MPRPKKFKVLPLDYKPPRPRRTVDSGPFLHWMKTEGFTLTEAAERLGLTTRQVTNLRTGHSPLRRTVVLAMRAISAGLD